MKDAPQQGDSPADGLMRPESTVGLLLERWSEGDRLVANELIPYLYEDLHRLAANYLRAERVNHTLQPTAVVHEAYLKFIKRDQAHFQDRAHFIAMAACVMRRVLVDHSRERGRVKRGGRLQQVTLAEAAEFGLARAPNLVELDEALADLAKIDHLKASIVELRYFGGLSIEEIASVLKISASKVSREWRRARAWLYQELEATGK